MLDNLFQLNGNPDVIESKGMMPDLVNTKNVKDKVFSPNISELSFGRVENVTFINTEFSKTIISKTSFYECNFQDCLFIATGFYDVEFHRCRFDNCTFWKTTFHNVYLNPLNIYFDRRYIDEAANVGISIYQQLLKNFADSHQDKFYIEADIQLRKWKRYQIAYELSKNHITKREAIKQRVISYTYELVAGFGYRPARFFAATIILFLIISFINYLVIGNNISTQVHSNGHATIANTVFYSFSILTVLGFSSIEPASTLAKLLSVMEALGAIGWLAIFTSVLVKRFIR